MKKMFVVIIALTAALCGTSRAAEFDPFTETPAEYNARVKWLRDAKFGVFLHWNPSVLCGGEISWIRRGPMGDMPQVPPAIYDELYKQFDAKKFNAREWVKLFEEAGLRYAVVVAKHHDGFAMWHTQVPGRQVKDTPFKRDYVKEMAEACEGSQVRFCLYYSIADWMVDAHRFPVDWMSEKERNSSDMNFYINNVMKPHLTELLTQYGKVGYIWYDGGGNATWDHAISKDIYGMVRRLQSDTLQNNRVDTPPSKASSVCNVFGSFYDGPGAVGDFQAREMEVGQFYADKAWDSCYNLRANPSGGWSWIKDEYSWPVRGRDDVLNRLIQCIGRDGALLLGVGPREDGTIDKDDAFALRTIGLWLKENGEAVYGTRGGPLLPGAWGVSACKGNKVFLFVQQLNDGKLTLPALPARVLSARMLQGAPVDCSQTESSIMIGIPRGRRNLSPAAIVELTLDQDAIKLAVQQTN